MATQEIRVSRTSRTFSKYASLIVMLIGGLVLGGWAFNIDSLKSVLPGLATMKANTALSFVLAGIALNLKNSERPNSIKRNYIAQACAFIVATLALLTLGESVFNQDLGIDQLLFKDLRTPEAFSPGRMSITTAIDFALLSTALLMLNFETRKKIRPAQPLALIAGAIAFIALIGYLYGVESLYTVEIYSSMALHTALGSAALSLGILGARPDRGLMEIATTESVGGLILRRLIPAALVIPVVLGWFRLQGQLAGLYDTNFGVALMALSNAASLIVLIWINAGWLNRVDTDRRNTEVVLGQREERFRHTLDSMLEGGQVIDFDWRYRYVNDAAVKQGRETKENLLGHTMMEVYPGIEHTELFTILRRCMQERVSHHMENNFAYPDGSNGWFELSIQPVDEGIFILSIDISERKHAEEKLRELNEELEKRVVERTAQLKESEEKFSKAFLNSPAAVSIASMPDGRYIDVNEALAQLTGFGKEELIGRTSAELGLIDSTARAQIVEAVSKFGFARNVEIQIHTKSNQLAEVLTSTEQIEIGGRACMLSVNFDITERKQSEAEVQRLNHDLEQRQIALAQANNLLQTLLDHIPDHIYFKDSGSRFIRNSRSQSAMMGLKDPAEVVGRTDFDFFPQEHAQHSYDEEQGLMRSNQPLLNSEEQVVWPDGRVTWVSTTKLPLRDTEHKVIGTFGISRDITARRQAEEDLQKSNTQLEAANRELEAFSYSVSHDLRAPLRTIDGFSQAVMEDYGGQLPEEGREHLTRVRKAAQHMASLIDDMLNLSRVTRAAFQSMPVNLSQIVEAITADLQRAQPERMVRVVIAPGLTASGDPNLLQIALENLLSNAWKFTAKQQLAEIEFGSKNENEEDVYFVRDNGAGFDMAYAGKLFGAFQRLHTMTEYPGTGVGLATVQRIILRHGGRIWAVGAVNQGATFSFTLK